MKKTNNAFFIPAVLAVMLVSGCIVSGDIFQGMFGPQQSDTIEASANLITIQNLNIIPNPPISADNTFEISFEVKNNDATHEVEDVAVSLYDSGLCESGYIERGGVIESDIVKKIAEAKIYTFDVECSDNSKQQNIKLMLDEQMFIGKDDYGWIKNLCSLPEDTQIEASNYKSTGKIGSIKDTVDIELSNIKRTLEYIGTYEEDDKDIQYDCISGSKIDYNNENAVNYYTKLCSVTLPVSGNDYKFIITDKGSEERTKCIGETDCRFYTCNKFCSEKIPAGKWIVDKSSGKTPCVDFYHQEKSFDGYCCSCKSKPIGPGTASTSTSAKTTGEGETYMPLQTELIEWGFTAPSNEQIGNMPAKCPIRYKISYPFIAKTQSDVTVISSDKLRELQRSGQDETIIPMQNKGIGPIKIDLSFGAKQPIKSGDVLPVFITVEDKGNGIYGKIPSGDLKLYVPDGFEKVSCSKFDSSYESNTDISMIKKKSPQLRCSFKVPDVTDMRTYYFKAELDYRYQNDEEIIVAINPTIIK